MPNMAVLLAAYTAKIFKNTIPHKYSFDNKHNYYLKAILPLIKFLRIVSLTLNDIIFVCFILNNMFWKWTYDLFPIKVRPHRTPRRPARKKRGAVKDNFFPGFILRRSAARRGRFFTARRSAARRLVGP